jgi:hypothetical protein
MELINSTRMVAGYTMGMEPSGRELLVVVVKGTFQIPAGDEPVRLADEQLPLALADTFTGEPGFSATVYEADFAPRKPRCDVLLLGSAYGSGGRPATRVSVGIRVGQVSKQFAVVGNRHWHASLTGFSASPPEAFPVMPISYDRAFGGVDDRHDDPRRHAAFTRNPVGVGFHKHGRAEWVDGAPLPNTEELNRPVDRHDSDQYIPMAFGPIGRGWEPRLAYAGTYDDRWLQDHFPFLPPDFDEQYYQAAPRDQQIPHLRGGEEVVLINVTPDGRAAFILPSFEAPVHIFPKQRGREDGALALDTLCFEPDRQTFTMTWRATRPLRKSIREIAQVMVGKRSQEWWAARETVEYPLRVLRPAARTAPTDSPPGGQETA